MRSRGRYILVAALLGSVLGILPVAASSAPGLTGSVTAENIGGGVYGEEHLWTPPQVAVKPSGVVTFSNPTEVRHGIHWISPPATPTCDNGVPVGTTETSAATKWSGTCEFTQPGAYIYYCTVHGSAMRGTVTVPGTPTATTEQPTQTTQTGATLGGAINPQGEPTSYYFEYGTTPSLGQKTPGVAESVGSDFASHHVSASLKGLLPSTEYHVKVFATYGATTISGVEKVFTTAAPAKPSVTTGQAGALTQTGATLNGTVGPEGQETSYSFEYGLSTTYEKVTPTEHVGPEGFNHAALVPVAELAPDTLYHFRLVAENALGVARGEDHTFKTASPAPTPPPPTTTPPPTEPPLPSLTPKPEEPHVFGSPLVAGSLKLTAPRHSSAVHGSFEVAPAGAGDRVEVDLLAGGASLTKKRHAGSVRVGRLLRSSVSAGKVSFAVALTSAGKRALAHRHRLALTVKITLTPKLGSATTLTHNVTLRS